MVYVEAHNVRVLYGDRLVLDGVSFALPRGELVALIGPNGAGKTTLLNVLLGALRPERGVVSIEGVPISRLAPAERARHITVVPQSIPSRVPLRVEEAVALGRLPYLERFAAPSGEDETEIARALARTGLESYRKRRLDELSAGERQRVHLARALAQTPRVLLLDEPTANLDLAHRVHTLELMRDFADRGGAVLAALHDLSLASDFADRVVALREGRVVGDGSPGRVLSPEAIGRIFGVRWGACHQSATAERQS